MDDRGEGGAEAEIVAALREALARGGEASQPAPARAAVVSVARQKLYLLEGDRVVAQFPVSTARAGVGGIEDSLMTPPGLHRIHAKVGAGEPLGAVFAERKATGELWRGEAREEDLILTRVLTLEGAEPGVNQGPGRDSLERCIYIHGTNHEDRLGTPASHGCIRLANRDVADLFERLEPGDPVVVA